MENALSYFIESIGWNPYSPRYWFDFSRKNQSSTSRMRLTHH